MVLALNAGDVQRAIGASRIHFRGKHALDRVVAEVQPEVLGSRLADLEDLEIDEDFRPRRVLHLDEPLDQRHHRELARAVMLLFVLFGMIGRARSAC